MNEDYERDHHKDKNEERWEYVNPEREKVMLIDFMFESWCNFAKSRSVFELGIDEYILCK